MSQPKEDLDHHCEPARAEGTSCICDGRRTGAWASRRGFVQALGAFGAVSAVASLAGCGTPTLVASPDLIDTHHHFYPPEYQKAWLD